MRDRLPALRPTSTLAWVLVAGLLVALVTRAQGIVAAVHSNADLAAPLAMSDLLARYPDAAATTGNYGWWNGLWVVQVLQHLTGGTLAASYLPLGGMVVAIAVLSLQAARLFGARAAVAVPLVAGSIGAVTWTMDGAWSGRAPSWWGMVALGVLLVARADGWPRRARVLHGAATVLVVLWCAAALSGDALAWTSIVLPALGVAAAAIATRRPRQAVFPVAAAVAVAGLSVVVREVAHHFGYFQRPSPTALTRFEEAQAGAGNVAVGLQAVWRGPDGSTAGAAAGYLGLVLVLAAVAAGIAALASVVGARWTRPAAAPGDDDTPASSSAATSEASFSTTAWAAFWVSMVLATVVAFAFSSSAFADGQPVARYLFGVPFAAGALLALLASRIPIPAMVVAPAGLLAVLAIVGMARETAPLTREARTPALSAVQAAAREEGVTRGYASYWSAYPMTVGTGFRLQIDPVGECPSAAGAGLCPMYLHYVDRAYVPRKGIRSFLLVDTGPGATPGGVYVTRAPDGITPIATRQIEPGLQMLVYDHDIASDLQPRTLLGDPLRHRG